MVAAAGFEPALYGLIMHYKEELLTGQSQDRLVFTLLYQLGYAAIESAGKVGIEPTLAG